MTLAAAGFPTGSITEIFACISSGSSPPTPHRVEHRQHPDIGDEDASQPVVRRAPDVLHGMNQLRWPTDDPHADRAVGRSRHGRCLILNWVARRWRSRPCSRSRVANRSSSSSVCMKAPLPWETLWTGRRSGGLSKITSRQWGSQYWEPPAGSGPRRETAYPIQRAWSRREMYIQANPESVSCSMAFASSFQGSPYMGH